MPTLYTTMTRAEYVAILRDLTPVEVAQVENAVMVLLQHPEIYSTVKLVKAGAVLDSFGLSTYGDDACATLLSCFSC